MDRVRVHDHISKARLVRALFVWAPIAHDDRPDKESKPEKTNGLRDRSRSPLLCVAEWTGLEPATPGVTGRYSNQLNYHSW